MQIRLLDETYLEKIMQLQEKIEKNITQKQILEPLTMQQYLDMLKERGKIIGCFEEERLIAFFGIWYPWQEEDNLAIDIGLEQSEYNKVAHLEISMVDNDFRGKKLHAKMLGSLLEILKKENRYIHICATVSPYNPWSFIPLLKQNMRIVALKKKYGGKLRYILYSNLQKVEKTKCVYKKNVDREDLQTQYKLLMDGYKGIDCMKQGEKIFIIFEKNRKTLEEKKMIEIGTIQHLQAMRTANAGMYLSLPQMEEEVLLPGNQVPKDIQKGEEVKVFIYKDSKGRKIATTKMPKITLGKVALLKVKEITNIGAFLDWGLEKDLFLPFKEQEGKVQKDKSYVVGLYVDKSDRLCATMKVYDMLECHAPYHQNQAIEGLVYQCVPELGIFVAVDNRYHGFIPKQEIYGTYKIGDIIQARVKNIRTDGKLELSMRRQMYQQMDVDAQKIKEVLQKNGGKLPLNDNSSPQEIKQQLQMSKAAFKRAIGRLLKQEVISLTEKEIQMR